MQSGVCVNSPMVDTPFSGLVGLLLGVAPFPAGADLELLVTKYLKYFVLEAIV